MLFRRYSGRVYRNFATIIESQELMDDLTANPERRKILNRLYYSDREKGTLLTPIERVLQKSVDQIIQEEIDSRFRPASWQASRYSDGTWGVLYAAESEETALKEALFHMMRFYREELQKEPLRLQRRVLSIRIDSDKCFDLTSETGLDREALVSPLISKDESGYPTCRSLAKEGLQKGAQMLRAQSARDPGGHVTPIFDKTIVTKDEGHLKYLRCLLRADQTAEVTGVIEEEMRVYRL